MTVEEKKKFRKGTKWRDFRKIMKSVHNEKDFITQKKLRRDWNLHHLDMRDQNYQDLSDTSKFIPLNKDIHELVHLLFKYYRHDKRVLDRLRVVMESMYKYCDK